MKICVYTCYFGNYRNEIKDATIDTLTFCNNIDYYLFTDNTSLKSKKWNIVIQEPINSECMTNYRWTTKTIKFVIPDIIKQYDIIIWCDAKCLNHLNKINSTHVISLFKNNDYKLINIKHPKTATLQQELVITIKRKMENINYGQLFLNEVQHIKYDTPLPDTSFIIRKNDEVTNHLFETIYSLMKDKCLKRDQNVYNHAIYVTNYDKKNILFITNLNYLSQDHKSLNLNLAACGTLYRLV